MNAIILGRAGWKVSLYEKKRFPFHKVCGEYVSNEVFQLLKSLGADPSELTKVRIHRLQLSAPSGNLIEIPLEMGGFSVSRYSMDHFLCQKAVSHGVELKEGNAVKGVKFDGDGFTITDQKKKAVRYRVVIGAYGKRSGLDHYFNRPFMQRRSPYVGVKCHYEADFPEDLVGLHNFDQGYCGLSKVENGLVNACYLTTVRQLKSHDGIPGLERAVLRRNPILDAFFEKAKPAFKQPLSISQMHFQLKSLVEGHVLMCGDAAGAVSPLSGNGMAMAIHGAQLCAGLTGGFLNGDIDRDQLEFRFATEWREQFHRRVKIGSLLQRLFGHPIVSEISMNILKLYPPLAPKLVALTHGEEVIV